jgi:hypothetical protein
MSHRYARSLASAALLLGCSNDPPGMSPDAALDAAPRDVTVDLPPEVSATLGLARALTITDVSVFQAVRVPLFAAGVEATPRSACCPSSPTARRSCASTCAPRRAS